MIAAKVLAIYVAAHLTVCAVVAAAVVLWVSF